jgi:hypothetical protein
MTKLLRGVLIASAAALGVGLVLHLAGVPLGDRITAAGLVTLVAIPVVNAFAAIAGQLTRSH